MSYSPFSLSIWDEERIGEFGEAKRPQGERKSTQPGTTCPSPVPFSLKVSATLGLWYQTCI